MSRHPCRRIDRNSLCKHSLMNHIQEIRDWFEENSDGDGEHENGVLIQTIDNPGGMVDVNIVGTDLEDIHFELFSKPSKRIC